MYDISQNPFYLYSVHRTSVSGERFRANGPLVLFKFGEEFQEVGIIGVYVSIPFSCNPINAKNHL